MLNDVFLVVSVLLLFIGLVASQGLLLVVGSLVILISLSAKLWDRLAFRQVTHSRSLSQHRAFIGDSLEYTVTLSNEKLLPLIWVDILDVIPEGLDLPGARLRSSSMELGQQHRITTSLLPYQRVSWKYNLLCTGRGYHRIGPVRLRSGDIFGFSSTETHFSATEYLLVYPRIVDLQQLIFPAEHPSGDGRGYRPLYQDRSRFMGHRDYLPSDPMKHIDWKASARLLRLQTKVFEPVVSLNVLIALNATTGEYPWQGIIRRYFERAVTAAASVASHSAERRYSFGLVSNAVASYAGRWLSVPLGASTSQLPLVLETLAMAGPYAVTSLVEVLKGERDSLPAGATVVLVTAIITRALAQEVAEMKDRGYEILVLYAGDGAPEMELPGVAIYPVGRALEALDDHEPILAR